jgi:probable F420-dependent oxidoreductase
MRFGLFLGPYTRYPNVAAIAELAGAAEEAGFTHVALGEHLITPRAVSADLDPVRYDPFALGAFLAARTTRLRILFNVLVVPYHHPVRLAKSIASLDAISDGRLTAGLGTGWQEAEFHMLNAPFRRRGAYTDEAVRLMRALWTGAPVNFHGEFFDIADGVSLPMPVQRPHPPLWIGGESPAALRRAVAFGEGWHPVNRPLDELAREVDSLRARFAAAGRDFSGFTVSTSVDYETVNENLQRYIRLNPGARANQVIAGSPPEQREAVDAYRRAGVGHLLIRLGGPDLGAVQKAVARFGREIIAAEA